MKDNLNERRWFNGLLAIALVNLQIVVQRL